MVITENLANVKNDEKIILFLIFLSFFNLFNLGKILFFLTQLVVTIRYIESIKHITLKYKVLSILIISIIAIYQVSHLFDNLNLRLAALSVYRFISVLLSCSFAFIIYNQFNKCFILKFLIIVSSATFFNSLIDVLIEISMGTPNLANPDNRYVFDIWKNTPITVTQIIGNMIMITIYPILSYSYSKNHLKSLYFFIVFILAVFISFFLGSRSFVVLSLIINILFFSSILDKKNKMFLFKVIMLIIFITIIIMVFDLGGIRTLIFRKTYLFQRILNIDYWLNEPRINTWLNCIKNLGRNPFGNLHANIGMEYAHNLLFDLIHVSGFVAIIPCIIIYFTTFKLIINIIKTREVNNGIIAASLGTLFIFTNIEPVIEGYFLHLLLFFMLLCYSFLSEAHQQNRNDFK